jgi:hypothetical protein
MIILACFLGKVSFFAYKIHHQKKVKKKGFKTRVMHHLYGNPQNDCG